MMARVRAFLRTLAGCTGLWGRGREARKKQKVGRQDKSTAVGLGADGWFRAVFCDGAQICGLALPGKNPINSTARKPSLSFLAQIAGVIG